MKVAFHFGKYRVAMVSVDSGYEALRDILEDNRSADACDRLVAQAEECACERSSWKMSFNSCHLIIQGNRVYLESEWDESSVDMKLSSFIALIRQWRCFMSDEKKLKFMECDIDLLG
ncbi:hypothetical protein ONV78_15965 [Hahella sp. CR1]|uniref:hypothetical protein n=1 Tax=Hahella sp. CR1 TaxID=2992807 RepID=UPI0024434F15|nr:hypothetical protein [Hahella sp. CR1]MDG9669238.1 hypothetical protein [Hahella sp. CR1]